MERVAFGLACIGFILLSLSMGRHYRQVWPQSPAFEHWSPRNRAVGYVCIAASLVPCVLQYGLWIGLVLWISMLAGATFLQSLLLTYWPQRSPVFGGVGLALIVAGLLL